MWDKVQFLPGINQGSKTNEQLLCAAVCQAGQRGGKGQSSKAECEAIPLCLSFLTCCSDWGAEALIDTAQEVNLLLQREQWGGQALGHVITEHAFPTLLSPP